MILVKQALTKITKQNNMISNVNRNIVTLSSLNGINSFQDKIPKKTDTMLSQMSFKNYLSTVETTGLDKLGNY